jgi:hypothetical protein
MNDRQRAIMATIKRARNGILGADRIAGVLGYKPARSGRLAVSSSLRALQRAGLVGRIPPEDQWDHADYFLTDDGKAELEK